MWPGQSQWDIIFPGWERNRCSFFLLLSPGEYDIGAGRATTWSLKSIQFSLFEKRQSQNMKRSWVLLTAWIFMLIWVEFLSFGNKEALADIVAEGWIVSLLSFWSSCYLRSGSKGWPIGPQLFFIPTLMASQLVEIPSKFLGYINSQP